MGKRKPWILLEAILILSLLLGACAPTPDLPPASTPLPTPAPSLKPSDTEEPSPPKPPPAPEPTLPEPTPAPAPIPPSPPAATDEFQQTLKSHFGFMPAMWAFKEANQAGGAYDRPFFELFQWGMIEWQPGVFNFHETDRYILQAQAHGLHILAY